MVNNLVGSYLAVSMSSPENTELRAWLRREGHDVRSELVIEICHGGYG